MGIGPDPERLSGVCAALIRDRSENLTIMPAEPAALNLLGDLPPATQVSEVTDVAVDAEILDRARSAKAAVLTTDGATRHRDARESISALRRASAALAEFDPNRNLPSRAHALAFWINVYNAMVIHGAIVFGVRRTMTEVSRFFQRTTYLIGGRRYNLDDIEHGILRGNRGHPMRVVLPQFMPWDARRALVIRPMDARIHFALNCGAASCPPIRHYTPENIDEELETASRAFVNGGGVRVDPDHRHAVLSRIFLWYARDFGWTKTAQLAAVMGHIDPDRRDDVRAAATLGLHYSQYDWSFA